MQLGRTRPHARNDLLEQQRRLWQSASRHGAPVEARNLQRFPGVGTLSPSRGHRGCLEARGPSVDVDGRLEASGAQAREKRAHGSVQLSVAAEDCRPRKVADDVESEAVAIDEDERTGRQRLQVCDLRAVHAQPRSEAANSHQGRGPRLLGVLAAVGASSSNRRTAIMLDGRTIADGQKKL